MKIDFYTIIFFLFVFMSCSDKRYGDNFFGKYHIKAIGDLRPSLHYEIDTSQVAFFKNIVDSYTYEVLWNDKFILVKQHPEYAAKTQAYECIRSKLWVDTVKKTNAVVRNELSVDTAFNKTIDSLAKIEFQSELENGDLRFIKNTRQEDVTFYYLIDVKNSPENPTVFFNAGSLNSQIGKLQVGNWTNKRTY